MTKRIIDVAVPILRNDSQSMMQDTQKIPAGRVDILPASDPVQDSLRQEHLRRFMAQMHTPESHTARAAALTELMKQQQYSENREPREIARRVRHQMAETRAAFDRDLVQKKSTERPRQYPVANNPKPTNTLASTIDPGPPSIFQQHRPAAGKPDAVTRTGESGLRARSFLRAACKKPVDRPTPLPCIAFRIQEPQEQAKAPFKQQDATTQTAAKLEILHLPTPHTAADNNASSSPEAQLRTADDDAALERWDYGDIILDRVGDCSEFLLDRLETIIDAIRPYCQSKALQQQRCSECISTLITALDDLFTEAEGASNNAGLVADGEESMSPPVNNASCRREQIAALLATEFEVRKREDKEAWYKGTFVNCCVVIFCVAFLFPFGVLLMILVARFGGWAGRLS